MKYTFNLKMPVSIMELEDRELLPLLCVDQARVLVHIKRQKPGVFVFSDMSGNLLYVDDETAMVYPIIAGVVMDSVSFMERYQP